MSLTEKVITFKQSEMDRIYGWLDEGSYRCGDDGWIPDHSDVDQMIALFDSVVYDLTLKKDRIENKAKSVIIFFMWVSMSQDISTSVAKRLETFIKQHTAIVPDNEV